MSVAIVTVRTIKTYSFPIESLLGLAKRYSTGLKRCAARCCGLGSYHLAADNLRELCGIRLSTVGDIAQETAVEIEDRLQDDSDIRNAFQQSKGEVEFQIDGTCIHIRNDADEPEWREMRVGSFDKRVWSESAEPSQWALVH